MSEYTIRKQGRRSWAVESDGSSVTFTTKAAAEQYVEQVTAGPAVVKNPVKGWDLTIAGDVVATFPTKAKAVAEMRSSIADAAAVDAEQSVDVEPEPSVDPATMTKLDRIAAAKAERAAVKAAVAAGEPKPATPVLDWMNDPRNDVARKAKSSKSTGTQRRYDDETTTELVERIKQARATGVSFPRLAEQLNAEGYRDGGWTGPKLYALACRHGVGKLPLVKAAAQ